jgi:hypothetical protein
MPAPEDGSWPAMVSATFTAGFTADVIKADTEDGS